MSLNYVFPNPITFNNQIYWGLSAPLCDGIVSLLTEGQIKYIEAAVEQNLRQPPPVMTKDLTSRQIVPCPPALPLAVELTHFEPTDNKALEYQCNCEEVETHPVTPLPSIWEGHFGSVLEHSLSIGKEAKKTVIIVSPGSDSSKENEPVDDNRPDSLFWHKSMTCNPRDLEIPRILGSPACSPC